MQTWQHYGDKFETLKQREKILTLGAGILVIAMLGFTYGVEPLWLNNNKAKIEITSLDRQIANLTLQQQTYALALKTDPNGDSNVQLAQLEKRTKRLDSNFSEELNKLVSPASMPALMASMLGLSTNLNLVDMKAITPINLFADKDDQDLELYQHGVRMVFNGSYANAQTFLESLEQTQWQVYWNVMEFNVQTYPTATLTIEFYTLSTEKVFIRV